MLTILRTTIIKGIQNVDKDAPKRFFSRILTTQHEQIKEICRKFAEKDLSPIAQQSDITGEFPSLSIEKLSKLGLMAMGVEEKHQGMGLDTLSIAVAVEELSRGCASTGAILSIHNCLYANLLNRLGTDFQKEKYLKSVSEGGIGCFALSEPNAGSDAANLQTVAVQDGNRWTLNGTKSWVTSAHQGQAIIVFAKVDRRKSHRGITAFIVDRDSPGLSLGAKDDLVGVRALSCCTVTLNDVVVNEENVLGQIGDGFKIAMSQLDQARIGIAAQALGISQAALDLAVSYASQRRAFNRPISELPAVQGRIAEMVARLEGARLLTWKAAVEYDTGTRSTKHTSLAKFTASTCANFVAENCIQIMGGMGLSKSYSAERHFRDARVTQIYGGVTDVHKSIIARELFREYSNN